MKHIKQEKMLDLVDIFNTFQRTVLEKKPPLLQMYNDVRMMNFKIRPLYGDLSILNFKNSGFVETLWSLGKLDEFFNKQIKNVSEDQRTVFHRLFDDMYHNYHERLNTLHMKSEEINNIPGVGFELEIFREHKEKRKLN